MRNNKSSLKIIALLVIPTLLLSACKQSLSSAPVASPTPLPTGLFVAPLPSAENPMAMIEEFAKQTAAAQTTVANGGTPVAPGAITPATTGTVITPQTGIIPTATPTGGVPSTPTNANAVASTPVAATSAPAGTPIPPGSRPQTYVLNDGEWPYCIARRFDVDPDALLTASGLTSPDVYYPGLKLVIPQSGSFPGARVLMAHPTTYTASAGETLYSIACKFGDLYPDAIASANGISTSATLTAGQQIKIP
jgi:LysM repeat protein